MTPNQTQQTEPMELDRESTDGADVTDGTDVVERASGSSAPLPGTLASPRSKLVYLYLRTSGGGSAGDLCDDLGMKRVAAYPVLDTLVRRGLIVRDGETFHCS